MGNFLYTRCVRLSHIPTIMRVPMHEHMDYEINNRKENIIPNIPAQKSRPNLICILWYFSSVHSSSYSLSSCLVWLGQLLISTSGGARLACLLRAFVCVGCLHDLLEWSIKIVITFDIHMRARAHAHAYAHITPRWVVLFSEQNIVYCRIAN